MMKLRTLTLALLVAGCAGQPVVYTKPGATPADFEQAQATCRYQAVAATANGGSYGMRTTIGAAMAQGQKQDELIDLCLKATGWRPTVASTTPR